MVQKLNVLFVDFQTPELVQNSRKIALQYKVQVGSQKYYFHIYLLGKFG
jgi:hypothetical protein